MFLLWDSFVGEIDDGEEAGTDMTADDRSEFLQCHFRCGISFLNCLQPLQTILFTVTVGKNDLFACGVTDILFSAFEKSADGFLSAGSAASSFVLPSSVPSCLIQKSYASCSQAFYAVRCNPSSYSTCLT